MTTMMMWDCEGDAAAVVVVVTLLLSVLMMSADEDFMVDGYIYISEIALINGRQVGYFINRKRWIILLFVVYRAVIRLFKSPILFLGNTYLK